MKWSGELKAASIIDLYLKRATRWLADHRSRAQDAHFLGMIPEFSHFFPKSMLLLRLFQVLSTKKAE